MAPIQPKIILIGSEISTFTAKVRQYLIFLRIPFQEILPEKQIMKHVVKPRTGVYTIPLLLHRDGNTKSVSDSTLIIDYCEKNLVPNDGMECSAVVPETPRQCLAAKILEAYADEFLMVPLQLARWSRADPELSKLSYPNEQFSEKNSRFINYEFGKSISGATADGEEAIALGEKGSAFIRSAVKMLGLDAETIPHLWNRLREFLSALSVHLVRYPFLLGYTPSVADFALFGQMVVFREPGGSDLRSEFPVVSEYYERCMGRLNSRNVRVDVHPERHDVSISPLYPPAYVADDAIPETLRPILDMFWMDLAPAMSSASHAVHEHVKQDRDNLILPRGIGMNPFTVGGKVIGNSLLRPLVAWKGQRIFDSAALMGDKEISHVIGQSRMNEWKELKTLIQRNRLENVTGRIHTVPSAKL